MSSSSISTAILFASKQYAVYAFFLILISGVIGNVCNILVLTCFKLFRRNQCAFYLTADAISDCCLLLVVLPFRISELAFAYDTARAALVWCKLKAMISYALTLIALSSICFAAIDQYLSTNHHPWLKRLSTLQLAHRLIYSAIVIWILYSTMFLVFYEIQPTAGCAIYNAVFSRYFSYFHYITLNGVIPITVSTTFSFLAYGNVRRIVQLRMPIVRRKLDKQLTAMVLAKVAFLVVTILPSIIFRIYILNFIEDSNDYIRIAIDQLISTISYSLFYINSSCTFYLFLMVSPRYRRQVKYTFTLVKNFGQRCIKLGIPNQVGPVPGERSDVE